MKTPARFIHRPMLWLASALLLTGSSRLQVRADCTPPPSGMIGWWKGDGSAVDAVAGNNGTLVNAGYTNGVVGQAFAFDPENYSYGTYCAVQIADQPAYALTNSLTIEGWVRPRGDGYLIFFRGDHRPGLDPYFLGMQGNNLCTFVITDQNGNSASVQTPLIYNQWTHLAATLDGSTGIVSIYTNSVLAGQTNTTIRPFGALDPTQSPGIGIGNVNDGGNNFPFLGDIDEIALYSRALSLSEIQSIYNAGSAGKCATVAVVSNGVPVISSFSPISGTNGALVTIGGTNFSSNVASNIVFFGAVQTRVLSASPNSLTVMVPPGATYAPITVAVGGLTAYSAASFEPTFNGTGAAIGSTTFAPGVNMNVASPIAAVIADLDGDGKPDLVVANVYANTFSIYQNIGANGGLNTNSFAAPVSFAVGSGNDDPSGVTVADLDGDGKLDLIVPDSINNQILVYHNISTGGILTTNSFALPVAFPVAGDPRHVVVRDLDGDGLPDIISVNANSGTLSILRNLGATGAITSNSFAPHLDLTLVGN